jgi:hypothetical protein
MLLGKVFGRRPTFAECLIACAIDGLAPFFLILSTNISSRPPKQLTWRRSVCRASFRLMVMRIVRKVLTNVRRRAFDAARAAEAWDLEALMRAFDARLWETPRGC